MTRLDKYRSAILAAFPEISDATLASKLNEGGPPFVSFIIDHGLGPLWHERTGSEDFRASRLSTEALYLAQERALSEIDAVLENAGIEYAVFKGAANRLLLLENPAIRPCCDIDLLVQPEDRIQAATALVDNGFVAELAAHSIGIELLLSKGVIDIDLHWRLLREGRLRMDCTVGMLDRRRRSADMWMLNAEDAFFVHLVHPAFVKHLSGWEMGLHRVVDIVEWVRTQSFDWQTVATALVQNGVSTAAWATLRWVQMLTHPHTPTGLDAMIADTQPGPLRRSWLDCWLRNDLSARTSRVHGVRLIGFSLFLHDTPRDVMRAIAGRRRAYQRSGADIEAFSELAG